MTEFLARPDTFPDHRVLEVLLYSVYAQGDTNALAHVLLNHFGSMAGVLDAPYEELLKIKGVGSKTAQLLKASKEIARRYLASRTSVENVINTTGDMYMALRPYFFGATVEMAYALCMDGKKKLLGIRKIAEGSVDSVRISARAVSEAVISFNCSRLVLAHNHVSGLAYPSSDDRVVTGHLQDVLAALEVALDDHLIFVDDDMVSMRESGMLAL